MTSEASARDHLHWTVHASPGPQAGGAFGADQAISDPAKASLWPSIAITPKGEAIAAWVTNDQWQRAAGAADRRHGKPIG